MFSFFSFRLECIFPPINQPAPKAIPTLPQGMPPLMFFVDSFNQSNRFYAVDDFERRKEKSKSVRQEAIHETSESIFYTPQQPKQSLHHSLSSCPTSKPTPKVPRVLTLGRLPFLVALRRNHDTENPVCSRCHSLGHSRHIVGL